MKDCWKLTSYTAAFLYQSRTARFPRRPQFKPHSNLKCLPNRPQSLGGRVVHRDQWWLTDIPLGDVMGKKTARGDFSLPGWGYIYMWPYFLQSIIEANINIGSLLCSQGSCVWLRTEMERLIARMSVGWPTLMSFGFTWSPHISIWWQNCEFIWKFSWRFEPVQPKHLLVEPWTGPWVWFIRFVELWTEPCVQFMVVQVQTTVQNWTLTPLILSVSHLSQGR